MGWHHRRCVRHIAAPFVTGAIEPGSTVIADAWQGYSGLEGLGYTREPHSQGATRARGPTRWAARFSAWI